jgi:hypothetical protein
VALESNACRRSDPRSCDDILARSLGLRDQSFVRVADHWDGVRLH